MPNNFPSFVQVLKSAYGLKGANHLDLEILMHNFSSGTLGRYDAAWKAFWQTRGSVLAQDMTPEEISLVWDNQTVQVDNFMQWLGTIPFWKWALQLRIVTQEHEALARNFYSALVHLPCCQQLRFEPLLASLKKLWGVKKPKYDLFYDIQPILVHFQTQPPPQGKKKSG